MASHGGARLGSGRPAGGISQARRLINTAITRGLAHAGAIKYPEIVNGEDLEECATQTAAMIVSDMIQAGQGNDVIKIWSQVAIKDNDKEAGKNVLADALARLPSAGQVADVTRQREEKLKALAVTGGEAGRPTDYKSEGIENQPYFSPQSCLLLDDPGEDDEADAVTIQPDFERDRER